MKDGRSRGSLGYLTKEGFRNIRANKLMSFASVAVLMSCLLLIGVAFLIFVNINSMIGSIEKQNVIMVYVKDEATDEQVEKLGQDINALGNIAECTFISKEEAFAAQLEEIGSAAALFEGMDEIPLPDCYEVSLENVELFDDSVSKLSTLENVLSITQNRDFAKQLTNLRQTTGYISVAVIVLLLIVSLFIISNTVKVTMYNRRLEISIMKSVGATKWFIRWPFMVEGIVLGIVSGIVSLGLVYLIYYFAIKAIGDLLSILAMNAVAFSDYALIMLAAFVATGVITGSIGSAVSMNKYLKEQDYDVIKN